MVSIPAPGHVNPSLEVVRRLVERGHRVTYVNDPAFREAVEATGAELAPYTSVLPRTNHAGRAEGDGPDEAFEGDAIDHLARFQDEYEVMLPAVRERFADDRPDLFLYDIAGIPARLLADAWGIPALQLSPTYVAWEGYEEDMAEFTSWVRSDPRGAAYLERQRAMLAAEGVTEDPLHYLGRPPRCVVLVPESLQPHADRVDRDVYTFTGPAVRRADADADADAWTPPTSGRVLLVSLGTAFTKQPELYRRCLEAFGDLPDWHLVLQVGRHVAVDEVTGGRPLPANVEIHPWVPQREILDHASVFLTHAGMGGANEGLVTGTPMIAAPQDVDQFDNADALVAAGVAVRINSTTIDVDGLRAALDAVTAPEVVARSTALAAEVAALGGLDRAVEVVESLLP
ncbi:glycosyl transferase [Nocardioides zeae]|uniref:Glycosyl transferase n=2 Tax=Nocardioides zeae TaxID=1457234 RepID=A0A6P0HK91_9ACTN|nr:macrolide family glycosyltransferase [Nocardioides zeae]NEN79112.1 glycosyl transferase [Nocardioides zeae]